MTEARCMKCDGWGCYNRRERTRDEWFPGDPPEKCSGDRADWRIRQAEHDRMLAARVEALRPIAEAAHARERVLRSRMTALLEARAFVSQQIEDTKHEIQAAFKRRIDAYGASQDGPERPGDKP